MNNTSKKWIVMAGLCCVAGLANLQSAVAAPPGYQLHTGYGHRWYGGHARPRSARGTSHWQPQYHRGSGRLASRVGNALAWSDSTLVPYIRGSLRHRRELESTASELLASPAASAQDRSNAEELLARIRAIP